MNSNANGITITEYVRLYAASTTIEATTEYQYFQTAQAMERWAKRPLLVRELTDELFNCWIKAMAEGHLAPNTVSGRRKHLLALCRAAHRSGLCPVKPDVIRRVKVPFRAPVAWTVEEVRRIVHQTHHIRGWFPWSGVCRADWWNAAIRAEWDTALRTCDLLKISKTDIDEHGVCAVTQQKTGYWFCVRVHPGTLKQIETIYHPRFPAALCWRASGESFRKQFRRLVQAAGLEGSFKKLRKSSASNVELHHPGHGAEHLGHVRSIATDHYFDPRIVGASKPLPEPLVVDEEDLA